MDMHGCPETKEPIKLAIIGCGRIVQLIHIGVLTSLPNSRIVAFAESDLDRRTQTAQLLPTARACETYLDVLQMPEVEAVIIAVPNHLHAEVTAAAIRHGKHVYLEKPLATSLEDGQSLLDLSQASDVVAMIGFNYRFHPVYRQLKKDLQRDCIGLPTSVRTVFSTAGQELPAWKKKRSSGGGVLLDLASHHFDLIRFLFDQDPLQLIANVTSRQTEQDTAAIQCQLRDGLVVQSIFSLATIDEHQWEICGERGKLCVRINEAYHVEHRRPSLAGVRLHRLCDSFRALVNSPFLLGRLTGRDHLTSYRVALSHFADCIRLQQPVEPNLNDGLKSLRVAAAAESSAQSGCLVRISELHCNEG